MYFNDVLLHSTLLKLVTDSFEVSLALLNDVVRVSIGSNTVMTASSTSSDGSWSHVVITLENLTQSSAQPSLNISVYIDDAQEGTSVEVPYTFPASLVSITAGSNYTGFLQDAGLYSPALSEQYLEPEPAESIPQCLCYPDDISSTDPSDCTGSTMEDRYNQIEYVIMSSGKSVG